jgi:hypothetical protein
VPKGRPTITMGQARAERKSLFQADPPERPGDWIGAGVFVRSHGPLIQIMDPKMGRKLMFLPEEFASFVEAAKAGAFDRLLPEKQEEEPE